MINLIGFTCSHCGTYYLTEAKTHNTSCPECGNLDELMMFTSDLTEEESELVKDVFQEIKGVFIKHNIEHSNIDLFNFIDKLFHKEIK
ncbi:MAG: hypothetical protein ACRCX2_10295 [Paraclostridium sp.]